MLKVPKMNSACRITIIGNAPGLGCRYGAPQNSYRYILKSMFWKLDASRTVSRSVTLRVTLCHAAFGCNDALQTQASYLYR